MKRYGNIYLLPFIIIIFMAFFPGFVNGSNTTIVRDLMMERTSILQEAYYGNMQIEEAERRLYQIETQPLLETDILALREAEYSQLDIIDDMRIVSLRQNTKLYDYLSFQGEIIWFMVGLQGKYSQTVNYNIVLKSFGEIYKLSELSPISTLQ